MINSLKKRKESVSTTNKSEMVKNCFWIPEQTPDNHVKETKKSLDLIICPGKYNSKNHQIKLRELIKLNMKDNDTHDKFLCCVCSKELSAQKIVALKKCGDVLCRVKIFLMLEMFGHNKQSRNIMP